MLIFLALLGCQPEVSTQSDGNRQALNQNNAQTIALLSEITVQDLVITEIMHNPEVEADWRGEWFEIYNAHTDAVDLQGLEVASANDTGFVVSGELIVQPGEYAVFANTSAADSNGGNAEVDYQYNYADLRFWDADSLSIAFQTTTFDSVSYDSAYPVAAGKSLSANVLDGSNNDTVDAWCRASSVYGDGDYGTPGFANDQCLAGDALTSGDLLITEIMHNPEAVADWKGEWFEIQNTSGLEINLNGLAFAGGSGGYTSSFSISDNLYLAPNAYFVFAVRAGDNGGLTADYYYDYNQMRFLDAGSIALSASGVVVDEVSWDSTWSLNSGVSLNLASQTSSSTLNDSSAYWCDATSTYGDGDYGTPGASNTACTIDQDGDGFGALDGDCDDSNADVNSDAMEVCDGVDNDCDGLVDEDDPNVDLDLWYLDFDGDGYGAPSSLTIISCSDPNEDASYLGTPYVQNADDCDDFDISIYPGAEEIWYDGVDQNCDQASDFDQDGDLVDAEEDCDDLDVGLMSFADDGDCDGVVTAEDCDDTDDTVTNSNLNDADCDGVLTSEDCDDADASVTNSNMDDADCDGVVTAEDCDDTDPTDAAIFNDCDQDGSLKADDCNDSNPTIYPGAPELCDGLDNACTGSVPTNEDDADNDGYVECTIDSNGWQGDTSIVGGDDCDDIRPYIYVGAAYNELTTECTRDQDGDGWGAYAIWAGNIRGTDCDDADAGSTYEGVDGDCDGVVTVDDCDDADETVTTGNVNDVDCDGVVTSEDCDDADASVTNSNIDDGDCDGVLTAEDCNDSDPTDAAIFNDCDQDGVVKSQDCDDSDVAVGATDADGDGFIACIDDCDDSDATIGATDADGDGFIACVDDCDDSDASLYSGVAFNEADPTLCVADADGDGYAVAKVGIGACIDFEMTDTSGDGWNGTAIEVYEDGVFTGTYANEDLDGVSNSSTGGETQVVQHCFDMGITTVDLVFIESYDFLDRSIDQVEGKILDGADGTELGSFNGVISPFSFSKYLAFSDGVNYENGDTFFTINPSTLGVTMVLTGGSDCDDSDATIGATDADGDGFIACVDDCDDSDATLNADDLDGDGFSTCEGDCNEDTTDADGDGVLDGAAFNPGMTEIWYDGIDSDCRNDSDFDADGDGYEPIEYDDGTGTMVAHNGLDCDDSDATLNADDLDGDGFSTCDADCDDSDATIGATDADGDGFIACVDDCDDSDATLNADDLDGDGFSTCDDDCDDTDEFTFPAAGFNETGSLALECLTDADGDGYAAGISVSGLYEVAVVTGDCFDVTIIDSYGDGCNGTVDMYIDYMLDVNIAGPAVDTVTEQWCATMEGTLQVGWTEASSFNSECGFSINDASGTEVYVSSGTISHLIPSASSPGTDADDADASVW